MKKRKRERERERDGTAKRVREGNGGPDRAGSWAGRDAGGGRGSGRNGPAAVDTASRPNGPTTWTSTIRKKKEETKTIQFLEFHGRRIRRHQPRESSTWHNVIVVVGDVELIEIENSSTVLKDAVDLLSASSRRRPHGVALVAAPALGRRQPLSKRTSTKTR